MLAHASRADSLLIDGKKPIADQFYFERTLSRKHAVVEVAELPDDLKSTLVIADQLGGVARANAKPAKAIEAKKTEIWSDMNQLVLAEFPTDSLKQSFSSYTHNESDVTVSKSDEERIPT